MKQKLLFKDKLAPKQKPNSADHNTTHVTSIEGENESLQLTSFKAECRSSVSVSLGFTLKLKRQRKPNQSTNKHT